MHTVFSIVPIIIIVVAFVMFLLIAIISVKVLKSKGSSSFDMSKIKAEFTKDGKIVAKCPNCGASTTIDRNKEYSTCEYCGASIKNTEYKNIIQTIKENAAQATRTVFVETPFTNTFSNTYTNNAFGMVAYIEHTGLFYNGEIPGITFGKVNMCDSYEECVAKLREIADSERNKASFKPPQQNIEEIQKNHPRARIINI